MKTKRSCPKVRQQTFSSVNVRSQHRYSYGGSLRNSSRGRGARPLSGKDPIHLVLKINKVAVKRGLRHPRTFTLMTHLLKKYSRRFFVKIEQFSIQRDHVHLLIRGQKRAQLLSFFRVVPGQFAQIMTDTLHRKHEGVKVWKYRPFSRVVKGYRAYRIVQDYIKLNELEVTGKRAYSKNRLRGMTLEQRQELWSLTKISS